MVKYMKTRLSCDIDNLRSFYGQDKVFYKNLPRDDSIDIEKVDREKIYDRIKNTTKNCSPKGCYDKGVRSFNCWELLTRRR